VKSNTIVKHPELLPFKTLGSLWIECFFKEVSYVTWLYLFDQKYSKTSLIVL